MTLNAILREMKDVPVSRLEELYQFVHSLTSKSKQSRSIAGLRKKILSYGGAFADMSSKDYAEFLSHSKKIRARLLTQT